MTQKVDLYSSSYGNYALDPYREVRLETYGEDFGQTSWVTTEESHEIPRRLELQAGHIVLEIGCGSGNYAVHIAESYGCRIVGLDLNSEGIANANQLAEQKKLASQATFQQYDVSQPLPFPDQTFDAAFSNDVFCHVAERLSLLRELHRVLRPGGGMLFSDALVVGGILSNQEIATRSSIARYVFVPIGENEKLVEQAGFQLLAVTDTTGNAATIARRWHDAREKRKAALAAVEGEANFAGLQRFLLCAHTLAAERRLLRCVYLARK